MKMDVPDEFLYEPDTDEDYDDLDETEDMEVNEKQIEKEIKYYIG
jgi:hypothetical protein